MNVTGRKIRRRVLWLAVIAGAVGGLWWGVADFAVRNAAAERLFARETLAALPNVRAAVVLGCARKAKDGTDNLFYRHRIRAAAELYAAGKVRAVIVSGDNHVKGYDEPSDMKADLTAAGVPAEKVVCDYAGFRTLDSVVRAKEVFGADSFVIVSQPFHVRRALLLARGFGCVAYGYAAEDVCGIHSVKTLLREQLAKMAALLDVVVRRQPKFLGPKVDLE